MTPDVIADFTSIQLGRRAGPREDHRREGPSETAYVEGLHRLSLRLEGYRHVGLHRAARRLRKRRSPIRFCGTRLSELGLTFEKIHTEFFGVNACHAHLAPEVAQAPEVQLRVGVRDPDRSKVERFTRELIPLILNGPPGATGYGEGRPQVREIVAYWPALLPRDAVYTRAEVIA